MADVMTSGRRAGRSTLLAAVVVMLKRLGLQRPINAVLVRSPRPVQLVALRLKVRAGHAGLVPADALQRAFGAALRELSERTTPERMGHYLEFGVYAGTSMAAMYRALRAAGLTSRVRCFGFDSFEGMPPAARLEDGGRWKPGQYASALEIARENIAREGAPPEDVVLVKGWFEETLTPELIERFGIARASVIMVDSDIYSSARTALTFCTALIDREAVIFFDDWDAGGLADRGLGERKAFEEWLAANPELSAEERPYGRYKDVSRAFVVRRVNAT